MAESGGLTAPEAFALISLPRLDIRKALKLGFLGLLDRDPAQAAALAVAAGGAILLVEELRPHYNQLARAFQDRDPGSSPVFCDPSTSAGGADSAVFDFGCIDFGSVDLGSFDSFGSGFAAASDGGGGDGGGSGC